MLIVYLLTAQFITLCYLFTYWSVYHFVFRVTPVYAMVIVLAIFVVPHLGSGPLWLELARYTQHCNSHWWTNLLYINNFVHEDNVVGLTRVWSEACL